MIGLPEQQVAYVQVILQVIAIAAALWAAYESSRRAKQRRDEDLDDIRRLATRGETIPLGIGRFRVPGFFVWRQDGPPIVVPGGSPGKWGFSANQAQQGTTFREYASQALLTGEGRALHSIRQDGGETIFEGPITPISHPSGSLVECNEGSSFRIYWGERDQPLSQGGRDQHFGNAPNTDFLDTGNSTRQLATRMPGIVRVDWQWKELGPSRTWQRIEYEIDAMITSGLAESGSITPGAWDNTDQYTFGELKADRPEWISGILNYIPTGTTFASGASQPADIDEVIFRVIDGVGGDQYDSTRYVRIAACTCSQTSTGSGSSVGDTTPPDLVKLFPPGSIVRMDDGSRWTNRGAMIAAAGLTLESFSFNPNPTDIFRYFFVDRAVYEPGIYTQQHGYINGESSGSFVFLGWTGTVRVYLGPELDPSSLPSFTPRPPFGSTATEFMRISPVRQIVEEGGINGGHMIDQLMFAKWPSGASLGQEFFDIDSLERVARALGPLGESFRGSVSLIRNESFKDILKEIFSDLGVVCGFDPKTGLYRFDLLRELTAAEVAQLPYVPASATTRSSMPGVRSLISNTGSLQTYTFADQSRNYQDMPIVLSSDGSRRIEARADLRRERIVSTGVLDSALDAAERRSRKSFTTASRVELFANREARMLRPGMRFIHEQFDRVLFVVTIKRSVLTDEVQIRAGFDAYGGDISRVSPIERRGMVDLGNTSGTRRSGRVAPLTNWRPWEVPVQLTPGTTSVVTLVERSSQGLAGAATLLSGDGTTYFEAIRSPWTQARPVLDADALSTGALSLDFSVTPEGTSQVVNLTGSAEDFASGLQMLLVEEEIVFWDGVGGFLRGQLGTTAVPHTTGTPVWVIRQDRWDLWGHPLLSPGRDLSIKALPLRAGGRTSIREADVPAKPITILGTGLGREAPADTAVDINNTLRLRGLIK